MRFRTLAALLLLLAIPAKGQDIADRLAGGSTVCFSFRSEGKLNAEGSVRLCGSRYHVQMGPTEIYCDSLTRWTLDRDSRELYIEPADGAQNFWAALPYVQDLKVGENEITGAYDGTTFHIHTILWLPKMPEEAFRFNAGSLPADWVCTDLRL